MIVPGGVNLYDAFQFVLLKTSTDGNVHVRMTHVCVYKFVPAEDDTSRLQIRVADDLLDLRPEVHFGMIPSPCD